MEVSEKSFFIYKVLNIYHNYKIQPISISKQNETFSRKVPFIIIFKKIKKYSIIEEIILLQFKYYQGLTRENS